MKVLLTFASSSMRRSAKRFVRQASDLHFYDKIYSYNENNLSPDFRHKHKAALVEGTRGFGYWCWKPQIIYQVLEGMSDGDVLQYTDAGCHLNPHGMVRLKEYFELAKNSRSGILAFQLRDPSPPLPRPSVGGLDLPDCQWIKGDLLDYFSVRDNESITHTQTIGAGIVFIRKCEQSMTLINNWRNVVEADFSLIDDTPSKSKNMEGFREHRHDQAIFSLICKLASVETISAYEYWYPSQYSAGPDWKILESYPVHAKRDKDFGILGNARNFLSRIFSKFEKIFNKL
jgi:hypothetical protein